MRGVLEAGGCRVRELLCLVWRGEVLRHRLQGQGGHQSPPGVPDSQERETLLRPGQAHSQGLQEGGSPCTKTMVLTHPPPLLLCDSLLPRPPFIVRLLNCGCR